MDFNLDGFEPHGLSLLHLPGDDSFASAKDHLPRLQPKVLESADCNSFIAASQQAETFLMEYVWQDVGTQKKCPFAQGARI